MTVPIGPLWNEVGNKLPPLETCRPSRRFAKVVSMDGQRDVRASDSEREAAACRLLEGVHDGRLTVAEYDARVAEVYASATHGQLNDLLVDLPAPKATTPSPAGPSAKTLRTLWKVWLGLAVVCVIGWIITSSDNPCGPDDFWPMWMAIPGIALLALSRGRLPPRRQ